jgi:uncharacterized protein YbjT (DUF2867 family)
MILVTSASGRVGTAIVHALMRANRPVRAFVHGADGQSKLNALGLHDAVIGDLMEPAQLEPAFNGVTQVFHIGPPEHPRELAIGQALVDLAQTRQVQQFVYFSVLQPYLSSLRHHWNKLLTQEYLVDSGVPYTILNPTMLMTSPEQALQNGVLARPWPVDQPMSMVDLSDVAEVAVKVLTEDTHLRAAYDLVGDQPLTLQQMAEVIARTAGKPIRAEQVPLETVLSDMPRDTVIERYGADSLERMFMYYARNGLMGNANVLGWLLGRTPTTYAAFVRKSLGV